MGSLEALVRMKTFVLILHFTWGGQSVSSVAVPGFKSAADCDAFAERTKTQHKNKSDWSSHPLVYEWQCVAL